jgi:hypothetical protein
VHVARVPTSAAWTSNAKVSRGLQPVGFSSQRVVDAGGVVPASEHQEILVALASLIRAQRYEMALTILDNELGGGC